MVLNALIHRNYFGAPVQLRVYDDKISVWNDGELPNGITLESLNNRILQNRETQSLRTFVSKAV